MRSFADPHMKSLFLTVFVKKSGIFYRWQSLFFDAIKGIDLQHETRFAKDR